MDNNRSLHTKFPVTLDNCKYETIRITGAIQTFGVLIAFDPQTQVIKAMSQNTLEHFPQLKNFEEESISIQSIFKITEPSTLTQMQENNTDRRFVEVEMPTKGKYDGVRYFSTGLEVLEIEMHETSEKELNQGYLSDLPRLLK